MPSCRVNIYQDRNFVQTVILREATVIGRRDPDLCDPQAIQLHMTLPDNRLVIADEMARQISRTALRVSPLADGRFRIENCMASPITLPQNDPIPPKGAREFDRELLIEVGVGIALRVAPMEKQEGGENEYRSLAGMPTLSATTVGASAKFADGMKTIGQFGERDAKEISKMLRLALGVVHKAAGTSAFFQAAVEAAMEIVKLDGALLLIDDPLDADAVRGNAIVPGGWFLVAESWRQLDDEKRAKPSKTHQVSFSLLNRVLETSATVIHDPSNKAIGSDKSIAPSLQELECAVASPILNRQQQVIGILYGYRRIDAIAQQSQGIADVEGTLVEILAGSVAGGVARRAEEKFRGKLSEFFSPRVADLLVTRPELMAGQDVEVSVLFCDIRGFSTITEKLGPQKAIQWINDVMSELSQCVINSDGVLVDYVGDELLAMWGAPSEQPDHAERAVNTARAMLSTVKTLSERWHDVLSVHFDVGIGVNTGLARVGNVGSRQKFKYGPLGNTVNIGSRLQSATKQLGVKCVVSGASVIAAGCRDSSRRLTKIGVVGIEEPIEVYEAVRDKDDSWSQLRSGYEQALTNYELGLFGKAARQLGELMSVFPDDQPSRKLLARTISELDGPAGNFSGVWMLSSK